MSEAAAMFLTLLVCLAFEGHSVYGETQPEIEFVANTLKFKPTITKDLTLRCSVNANVKKKFDRVMSIVIQLNREWIATITNNRHPKPLGKIRSDLKVTGRVHWNTSIDSFLQVAWSSPGEEAAGEYWCVIWGNFKGNARTPHSSSLQILQEMLTVKELAQTVQYLAAERKKQNVYMEGKIVDLTNENVAEQKKIVVLEGKIVDLTNENFAEQRKIVVLDGKIVDMTNENADLKKEIERKTHIESGVVSRKEGFGKWRTKKSVKMSVTFNQAYETPPKVTTAVEEMGIHNIHSQNFNYNVHITSVTTTGFDVSVTIDKDSFHMNYCSLTWTSFPQGHSVVGENIV